MSRCITFVEAPFDGKYLTSYMTAVVMIGFSENLLVKKSFEKFDFENLGQGNGVQHSQYPIRWHISTSIKVMPEHFPLAHTVFEILTFQNS